MSSSEWHVDIDTTHKALERFAVALLTTGAELLPSRLIMDSRLGRGVTAFVVVRLPDESVDRFREVCAPIAMRRPGRLAPLKTSRISGPRDPSTE